MLPFTLVPQLDVDPDTRVELTPPLTVVATNRLNQDYVLITSLAEDAADVWYQVADPATDPVVGNNAVLYPTNTVLTIAVQAAPTLGTTHHYFATVGLDDFEHACTFVTTRLPAPSWRIYPALLDKLPFYEDLASSVVADPTLLVRVGMDGSLLETVDVATATTVLTTGTLPYSSAMLQSTMGEVWLYVTNSGNDTISRIKITETSSVVDRTLVSPGQPRGCCADLATKTLYVANYATDSVSAWVWNDFADDYTELQTVLPGGFAPVQVVLTADHTKLVVLSHRSAQLAVLDAASLGLLALWSRSGTAPFSWDMALVGRWLFIANSATASITVVDTTNGTTADYVLSTDPCMPCKILATDHQVFCTDYETSQLYTLTYTATAATAALVVASITRTTLDLPRLPLALALDTASSVTPSLLVLCIYASLPSRIEKSGYYSKINGVASALESNRHVSYLSDTMTVTNLVGPVTVQASVSIANYKVTLYKNGISLGRSNETTAVLGDQFQVEIEASPLFLVERYAYLVVGNSYARFSVTTKYQPPLSFFFEPVVGATPGATYTSNEVVLHWPLGTIPPVRACFGTLLGENEVRLLINDQEQTGTGPFNLQPGMRLRLQAVAPAITGTTAFCAVLVADYAAYFPITTRSALPLGQDDVPAQLFLPAKLSQPLNLPAYSEPIIISGINVPTLISIPTGAGAWDAVLYKNKVAMGTSAWFSTNDILSLSLVTLPLYDFDHWLPVAVSGKTGYWQVRTGKLGSGGSGGQPTDYTIQPFKFFPVYDAKVGDYEISNEIVVLGLPPGIFVYAYLTVGCLIVNDVPSAYAPRSLDTTGIVQAVKTGDRIRIGAIVEKPWGSAHDYTLVIEGVSGTFVVHTFALSPISYNYSLQQDQSSQRELRKPRKLVAKERVAAIRFLLLELYRSYLATKVAHTKLIARRRVIAGATVRVHHTATDRFLTVAGATVRVRHSAADRFQLLAGAIATKTKFLARVAGLLSSRKHSARAAPFVVALGLMATPLYQHQTTLDQGRARPRANHTRTMVMAGAVRHRISSTLLTTRATRQPLLSLNVLWGLHPRRLRVHRVGSNLLFWRRPVPTARVSGLYFVLAGRCGGRSRVASWLQQRPALKRALANTRKYSLQYRITSIKELVQSLGYLRNKKIRYQQHLAYQYRRVQQQQLLAPNYTVGKSRRVRNLALFLRLKQCKKFLLLVAAYEEQKRTLQILNLGAHQRQPLRYLYVLATLQYLRSWYSKRGIVAAAVAKIRPTASLVVPQAVAKHNQPSLWLPASAKQPHQPQTQATTIRRNLVIARAVAAHLSRNTKISHLMVAKLSRNLKITHLRSPILCRNTKITRRKKPQLQRNLTSVVLRKILPVRRVAHLVRLRNLLVRNFVKLWPAPTVCSGTDMQVDFFASREAAVADAVAAGWTEAEIVLFETDLGCWGWTLRELPPVECSYLYPKGYITGG